MSHTALTQPMAATMHAFGTFVSICHFDPVRTVFTVAPPEALRG
jgi:hypothetical protein